MASLLIKSKSGHSQPLSSLQTTMLIILLALKVVLAEDTVDIQLVVHDSNNTLRPTLEVTGRYENPFVEFSRKFLNYDEEFAKKCFYHNSSATFYGEKSIPFPDHVFFTDAESKGLFTKFDFPETKLTIKPMLKAGSVKTTVRRRELQACSKNNLEHDTETEISCDRAALASQINTIKSSFEEEFKVESTQGINLNGLLQASLTVGMTSRYGSATENTSTTSTTFLAPYKGKVPPNKYALVRFRMVIGSMEAIVRSYVNLSGYVLVTFEERFMGHYYYFVPASGLDYCAGRRSKFVDTTYNLEYIKTLETKQKNFDHDPFISS